MFYFDHILTQFSEDSVIGAVAPKEVERGA
jgi:hypothetical protein